MLHCCICRSSRYSLTYHRVDRLKHVSHILFRFSNRVIPLVIALFLIAAQTLVALHSVAHAKNNSFGGTAERTAFQGAASTVSTSPKALDAQSKLWTALFGHALDRTDNSSACAAWDAAFADAGTLDSPAQLPVAVFYVVAPLLPVASPSVSIALLGIALARAPPQA